MIVFVLLKLRDWTNGKPINAIWKHEGPEEQV